MWVSLGQLAAKSQAVTFGGLRKILPPGPPRTTPVWPRFDSRTIGSSSNFDSLQLCSQLTYRDPQYLFGKILTSLTNPSSIKRTKWIFNTSYALSKRPHLHRAYVISGCIFFWLAVSKHCKSSLVFLGSLYPWSEQSQTLWKGDII